MNQLHFAETITGSYLPVQERLLCFLKSETTTTSHLIRLALQQGADTTVITLEPSLKTTLLANAAIGRFQDNGITSNQPFDIVIAQATLWLQRIRPAAVVIDIKHPCALLLLLSARQNAVTSCLLVLEDESQNDLAVDADYVDACLLLADRIASHTKLSADILANRLFDTTKVFTLPFFTSLLPDLMHNDYASRSLFELGQCQLIIGVYADSQNIADFLKQLIPSLNINTRLLALDDADTSALPHNELFIHGRGELLNSAAKRFALTDAVILTASGRNNQHAVFEASNYGVRVFMESTLAGSLPSALSELIDTFENVAELAAQLPGCQGASKQTEQRYQRRIRCWELLQPNQDLRNWFSMLIPVESDMSACFAENDDILFAKLDILLEQSGEDDVAAVIALQKQKPECISDLMIRYAKHLRQRGCKYEDHYFSAKAMDYSIADKVTHAYCWSAKQSGLQSRLPEAIALLSENNESPERLAFVKKFIHSEIFIPDLLKSLKPRASNFSNRDSKRVCYILHNALPFASGGYATRAHGVATGLASKGYEVYAITRPGFPVDIKAEFAENYPAASEVLDGVTYLRSYEPIRSNNLLPQKLRPLAVSGANYITQAMQVYYRQFSQLRPSIVMAASNFITALPALLAARMLNIPFIYEVRGFWEVTRMSREPEYAKTSSYNLAVQMEAIVAQEAEHVFTLTEAMREELIRRGVSADRVQLLPNSTYPEKFHPRGRDKDLATKLAIPSEVPVIGYIGTFVDYEGLEDMAAACGLLKQRGYEFRLMVVGNENTSGTDQGPITTGIRRYAQDNGFEEWLIMPGRVPHDVVESYYSLIDIAPFPRKPVPVCEMVSPMKPLEAFAMEKAVVASDVRALEEMVLNNKTGLLFEKGNIKSFADTLEKLIVSPDLRLRLGKAGRQWVIENRDWRFIGEIVAQRVKTLSIS